MVFNCKSWFILRVLYTELMVVYKFTIQRQIKELFICVVVYILSHSHLGLLSHYGFILA